MKAYGDIIALDDPYEIVIENIEEISKSGGFGEDETEEARKGETALWWK